MLFSVLQKDGAREGELTVPLPFFTSGLCVQVWSCLHRRSRCIYMSVFLCMSHHVFFIFLPSSYQINLQTVQ